jgi:hypothetical protein
MSSFYSSSGKGSVETKRPCGGAAPKLAACYARRTRAAMGGRGEGAAEQPFWRIAWEAGARHRPIIAAADCILLTIYTLQGLIATC